ncbi:hypothetical protein HanHA300_Chr13g0499151 [Helianthus annuus]|nr:hypothetical protein HanHA300_Chr13g0499151 [Helianthus annuus]
MKPLRSTPINAPTLTVDSTSSIRAFCTSTSIAPTPSDLSVKSPPPLPWITCGLAVGIGRSL